MKPLEIEALLVPFALIALWIFGTLVGPAVLAWIRKARGINRR